MNATPESLETAPHPIIPPLVARPGRPAAGDATATGGAAAANLAFFALALGVAGALLGVTVIWFFAAIPVGIGAVVTGVLALCSRDLGPHRSRAVLGTVLGLVAILLGVLSLTLLPVVAAEMDAAVTRARNDVTSQIDGVNSSLAGDVDRMNGTFSRELRGLQETSDAQLRRLERRLAASEKNLPAQQKLNLDGLAQQLRRELAALDTNVRGTSSATQATLDAMAARILTLEARLGITPPAGGTEEAPAATADGR